MSQDTSTNFEEHMTDDLCAEVLGPSDTDCMQFHFDDGDGTTFSVEFVDFEDPPFRAFNVAGPLPRECSGEDVADGVELTATDTGSDFVVFESDADDASEVVAELSEITDVVGVSMDAIRTAKHRQIETGFWNQLAKKAMQRLGMGRHGHGE